jgi:hypothetical protein
MFEMLLTRLSARSSGADAASASQTPGDISNQSWCLVYIPSDGMRQNIDPTLKGVDPIREIPGFLLTGDSLSTLDWVVFFDIFLTALNEV